MQDNVSHFFYSFEMALYFPATLDLVGNLPEGGRPFVISEVIDQVIMTST